MGSAFQYTGRFLKNTIFGHETFRSCICPFFLPQEIESEHIFALQTSTFRDTGRFSKLPFWGHENLATGKRSRSWTYITLWQWHLTVGQKFQKHAFSLGWNFLSIRAAVSKINPIFKIAMCVFGHQTCQLAKSHKVAYNMLSFYPSGSKLTLYSLYGQRWFRDKCRFFNIAIFGQDLIIGKISRRCTCTFSFYPQRIEIELIFA